MSNVPTDPVAAAVAALRLFCPPDRIVAAMLLGMWQYRERLTDADRAAVLAHFPEPKVSADPAADSYERLRLALRRRDRNRAECNR